MPYLQVSTELRDGVERREVKTEGKGEGRGGGGRGGGGRGGGGREVRERQLKEKHKGRVANHNRRVLADRKRGRGFGGPPRY